MRIDQIAEAYETLGLKPCQDEFYIETGDGKLCCPFVALALRENAVSLPNPKLGTLVYTWAVSKYGLSKVLGFFDGWDWRWPGKEAPVYDPDYREGFELGKAAVMALIMD